MKKFLCKVLIYALSLVLITLGINALYYEDDYTEKFIAGVPDNIQICNFGSSHGLYAFNYEDAMKYYTCFNFALASQSLNYDYRILQYYKDKIQRGADVFIVISYFSLFGKPEVQENGFASKNKRYYKFLPTSLIVNYDSKTNFYTQFPALTAENCFSLAKHILFREYDISDKKTNQHEANIDGLSRFKYHVTEHLDKDGRRIYKNEAIDALYEIINLCREIGANPIMITTPYLHEYPDAGKKEDKEFFNDFYGVINKVISDTGIKYYDYSADERYSSNYGLFLNVDHMNREGAKVFTNNLLHDVLGITF